MLQGDKHNFTIKILGFKLTSKRLTYQSISVHFQIQNIEIKHLYFVS
uniref:Uncharacterized protein n=1 Tax=Anguilla anguilla TaxID=7936 RepID=A0A0E9X352_ANGAN